MRTDVTVSCNFKSESPDAEYLSCVKLEPSDCKLLVASDRTGSLY